MAVLKVFPYCSCVWGSQCLLISNFFLLLAFICLGTNIYLFKTAFGLQFGGC